METTPRHWLVAARLRASIVVVMVALEISIAKIGGTTAIRIRDKMAASTSQ